MTQKIAVTGASGFIGQALVAEFARMGFDVVGISRDRATLAEVPGLSSIYANPHWPSDESGLASALEGVEMVFHLADDPDRHSADSGSARLASTISAAATSAGVRKLIFTSSIYARPGLQGLGGAYGRGKQAAEEIFLNNEHLNAIVLRLTPVYGPRSRGGIAKLAQLVARRLPLPFRSATAQRDYLSIGNLVSLLARLTQIAEEEWSRLSAGAHDVSDDAPIGTARLIELLGEALGLKPFLVAVPRDLLGIAGKLLGAAELLSAPFEPLRALHQRELQQLVGWSPERDMRRNLAYLSEATT